MIRTLADLVLHVRQLSAGRPELVSVRWGSRREVLSTSDFVGRIHSLALALEAEGLEPGERVAIFSENRPEWHITDFACQLIGAVTVPLYPNLPADQVGFILRNSGCRWVFFSDADKRDLLRQLGEGMVDTPRGVAFDADAALREGASITRLMGQGAERRGEIPLERFRGRVGATDLASIIYTSGTTGDPKGVMLTQRNLVSNMLACAEIFPAGVGDRAISFLPLSHVYQRTVDHLCFYRGVAIHYVPKVERLQSALSAERPTLLTSVPRIYERIDQRVRTRLRRQTAQRQRLFRWALRVGGRHAAARQRGFVGPLLALQHRLALRFGLAKVRDFFGGELRLAISGGAPLARQVAELFEAAGVPIYQGYGLTETSPVLTSNAPGQQLLGSVGRPLRGVELRFADDGEILVRSAGVMKGYWQNPAASRECLDAGGWLRTGDIGRLDAEGYLFITDRKKDLLVTSGGKNVAPLPIEGRLSSNGLIAQAVVVGDGQPHLAALLVPDFDRLAEDLGQPGLAPAELIELPAARQRIDEILRPINAELAEHERVRRFALLASELTIDSGELTPTLKIKRRVVTQHYREQIAALYPRRAR